MSNRKESDDTFVLAIPETEVKIVPKGTNSNLFYGVFCYLTV